MAETFGTVLRARRRAAYRSQGWLAAQVGLDVSYISKLENDRLAPPAAQTIVAFCTALAIDCDELLAATGKVPKRVQQAIGTSPAAQSFLREAAGLQLTDAEWRVLRHALQHLRPVPTGPGG
ncbi:MAG: helix-turn-helix domain-containing protein [Chloroflexia bacterium]